MLSYLELRFSSNTFALSMEGFNIKNPLLQFFIVGALLFAANYFFTGKSDNGSEVLITQENIDEIRGDFYNIFGENPDSIMMRSLLQREIENEILFQEGITLGLDKNNQAIKEELIATTKQFIMAQVDLSDPGDGVLKQFIEDNQESLVGFDEDRLKILNRWRRAKQLEYFDQEMVKMKQITKVSYELDTLPYLENNP